MVKKIINILVILTVIVLMTILLVTNYKTYQSSTNRLLEIFDINNLQNYFEIYILKKSNVYQEEISEIIKAVEKIIERIQNRPALDELFLNFFSNSVIIIFNIMNYFMNIGINFLIIMTIYYNETFNGTNLKIKYSKSAFVFLKISKTITFIKTKIKYFLKLVLKHLNNQKRKIAFILFLFLLANGLIYKILVEVIIFFITYIYHAIKLETMIIFSSLGKYLFLLLFPVLKSLPYKVLIPLIVFLVSLNAVQRANFKLKKNHERLKDFTQNTLTQTTFLNGPPGIGKTLLNVCLTLASEEIFIEELELLMLEYELKYPYINFSTIRSNSEEYLEHKEYLRYYYWLTNRNSLIISNYSIYSPYYSDYSKIFDFNFMRKNLKSPAYALEEYIVISISELDKEYNSHDDMKAVGQDGAATFFSTISHDLKRHVKIFADYQLKDQVPLRIRGNSEYFLTINKRKKKYPFLLFVYYAPFIALSKVTKTLIKRYETKRLYITKKTKRKGISQYKRNDYNLTYAILRHLAGILNKICAFFDHYWYFKISGILSQEDNTKGKKIVLNINISDLKINDHPLYDSTFLSYAYEEKKNKEFKDLITFKTLHPTTEELSLCNSRFYNKLNGIEIPQTNKKDNKKQEDEYVEV